MSQTQVLERTLFNKFTNTISLNKKLIQTGNDNSTLDILLCQRQQKAETKKWRKYFHPVPIRLWLCGTNSRNYMFENNHM